MAIINFGDSFISPWKKWALKQTDDEEESPPDMSASQSQSAGWDEWGGGMGFDPVQPMPEAPGFGASVGSAFEDFGSDWSSGFDDYVEPYTPPPSTGWGIPEMDPYAPDPYDGWGGAVDSALSGSLGVDSGWDENGFGAPSPGGFFNEFGNTFDTPDWGAPVRDWALEAAPSGYDNWDFGSGFPANLMDRYQEDERWADVQDLRDVSYGNWDEELLAAGVNPEEGNAENRFASEIPEEPGLFTGIGDRFRDWGSDFALPDGPTNSFNDITSQIGDAFPEPEYELGLDNWSMSTLTLPPELASMSADDRGNYVYFSGLKGDDYLTDQDRAEMDPAILQRIQFTDSRIDGGIGNGFTAIGDRLWDGSENIINNVAQLNADSWGDPLKSSFDPTLPGPATFMPVLSKVPGPFGDAFGDNYDLEAPLDDTIQNVGEASNPIDFMQLQNADFKERPWYEQMAYQALNPGSGLVGSADDANRFVSGVSRVGDALDGGFLFNGLGAAGRALGEIPGARTALTDYVAPAALGGATGAVTELVNPDQEYTNPFTGETANPGLLESTLFGSGAGVLGKQAWNRGMVPGSAGIQDISTPVVAKTVNQIDDVINVHRVNDVEARAELNRWKSQLFDELNSQHDLTTARQLWGQQTSGVTLDRFGPSLSITPEEQAVLERIIQTNAKANGWGGLSVVAVKDALDEFVATTGPNPERQKLLNLRAILMGEPPPPRAVDEVAEGIQPSMFGDVPSVVPPKTTLDEAGNVRAPRLLDEVPESALRPTTPLTDTPPTGGLPPYEPNDWEIAGIATRDDTVEKARMEFIEGLLPYVPTEQQPRILSEWEALRIAGPDDVAEKARMEFIESLSPYIPLEHRPRLISEWERLGIASPAAVNEKATQEFIDSLTPYIPLEHRPRIMSEWERLKIADAGDVADKERMEFIESISPYLPMERQATVRSEWEQVLGVNDLTPMPSDVRGLPGEALPKPVAEFIDAGPVAPRPDSPVQGDVDAWEKQITDSLGNVRDRSARQQLIDSGAETLKGKIRSVLDDFQATRIAEVSKKRVTERLQKIEDEKIAGEVLEWRKIVYSELDKMSGDAPNTLGGRASRIMAGAKGALPVELADGLAVKAEDLERMLATRSVPKEVAREIAEKEINEYIFARYADELKNNPKSAMLNKLYTSIWEGKYKPRTDKDGKFALKVTERDPITGKPTSVPAIPYNSKVGEVSRGLRVVETGAKTFKNSTFGLLDFAVMGINFIPSLTLGGMSWTLGMTNRALNVLGTGANMEESRRLAPFFLKTGGADMTQDAIHKEAGSVFGMGADLLEFGKTPKTLTKPLRVADKAASKVNDALAKTQYEWFMDKGSRQVQYEGNLLILKMLGRDISSVSAQRAAGNMADAVTSAATLSRSSNRRAVESTLMTSAMFTRAQGNTLMELGKFFGLHSTPEQRIIAAATALSVVGSIGIAATLSGNNIDLEVWVDDPDNPGQKKLNTKGYGNVTIPNVLGGGNVTFNVFGNTQVVRTAAAAIDAIASTDSDALYKSLAEFSLGRIGPLPGNALRGTLGVGYDAKAGGWSYPGLNLPGEQFDIDGKGEAWGGIHSFTERLINGLPIPTAIQSAILDPKSLQATLQSLVGFSSYDQGELDAALQKEGFNSLAEAERIVTERKESFATWKRDFYFRHPEIEFKGEEKIENEKTGEERPLVRYITEQKNEDTQRFMANEKEYRVAEWRADLRDKGNVMRGAFLGMDVDPGERPTQPGIDQAIYDFNQTFKLASEDDEGWDKLGLDYDKLDALQSEFWAQHPDPETRRQIIQYQLANKPEKAERMYIEDMARLNGFDPETGKSLTYPELSDIPKEIGGRSIVAGRELAGQPMPSYFDMQRYDTGLLTNDEAQDVILDFEKWRQEELDTDPRYSRLTKQQAFKFYTEDNPVAPDGGAWNSGKISDVMAYGLESKWTPEYQYYRELFEAERSWLSPKNYWSKIEALHTN